MGLKKSTYIDLGNISYELRSTGTDKEWTEKSTDKEWCNLLPSLKLDEM